MHDALVFYIYSENRCAPLSLMFLVSITTIASIHPSVRRRRRQDIQRRRRRTERTDADGRTNNNIIRSYEFLEMSFPPPPKKPPKKRRRRRRCPNARRTEHGQVINNATPRERGSKRSPTAEHGILLLPFEGFRCFSPLPLFSSFSFLGQATPVKCTRRIPADTRCARCSSRRRPEEESQYRRHVSRDKPQRGRVWNLSGVA